MVIIGTLVIVHCPVNINYTLEETDSHKFMIIMKKYDFEEKISI